MKQIIIRCFEVIVLISFALVSDIKYYKIKNKIILPFTAAGLITNICLAGFKGFVESLLGVITPVILLIILYALRMLGAGDIKLFSAIGSILGMKSVVYIMAYSFIAGGLIALIILSVRRNVKDRVKHLYNYFKTVLLTFELSSYTEFDNKKDGGKFRFAYAVFAGTLLFIVIDVCRL